MIICWDNLEKLRYSKKTGNWIHGNLVYRYKSNCLNCNESFLYVRKKGKKGLFCSIKCSNIFNKKPHNNKTKQKISLSKIGKNKGKNNSRWKGGQEYPPYDTFYKQLKDYEKIRKNIDNSNILEIKCNYCGKWFIPKYKNIQNRINSINGYKDTRIYCSESCKKCCPIFNQKKWPKGFKIATSREVQPELRQMVLERDGWKCQKCGSTENLHCHHIEGILWEPIKSADIDMCITVCKECHKEIHQIPGCGYHDMMCKE